MSSVRACAVAMVLFAGSGTTARPEELASSGELFQPTGWTDDWNVLESVEPAEVILPANDAALPLCDPEPWSWLLLPNGLMYTSYAAGERESRISTAFLYESGGDTLWDSTLGGRVGIFRYGTSDSIQPEGWQLDVEGAAFVRLLPGQESDVEAVDYRVGVPLTRRVGQWQTKLAYYHLCSHVGDEFLIANPGFIRRNYVKDAVVFGMGYFPTPSWRLYGEAGWACIFTDGGAEPWEFQFGVEYDTHRVTGLRGEPFFAANVHLFQEVSFGGNLNVLAGWQWRGRQSSHVFRAGLQYFNGQNSQMSFLGDNQQLIGGGIRYDY